MFNLIFAASRSITPRSAPTISAKSVLLTISRSDWVIPGPPFLGILSPPETSIFESTKVWYRDVRRKWYNLPIRESNLRQDYLLQTQSRVFVSWIIFASLPRHASLLKYPLEWQHVGMTLNYSRVSWSYTGLHCSNTVVWQCIILYQELSILTYHSSIMRSIPPAWRYHLSTPLYCTLDIMLYTKLTSMPFSLLINNCQVNSIPEPTGL
jgi:hypothetical protein